MESETSVVATSAGLVGVAWISIQAAGGSSNGYRFSTDGGTTWGPVQELNSPGGRVASDPVLAADAMNNVYMSWVGYHVDAMGNPTDMHVYVAVAAPGMTVFGQPVEVTVPATGDTFDKPWVTVTNKNTVIVTYAKTSTGGIYAGRSVDQGKTWTNAVIVEDGSFRNLVFPCPPVSGTRIWATYHAGGGVGLRWSDDDGVTWPDANKTAVAAMGEAPAFDDPTCAASPNGKDVWIAYGLSNDMNSTMINPSLYAIRLAHSPDGGVTIDTHVNAHDTAAGMFFQHPQLTLETGGGLNLVYYAGQAIGDTMGSFRRSHSTDMGMTFAPSVAVRQPIDFIQNRTSPKWLGDYVGAYWLGGQLYMSYADNTGMYSHVAFAKAMTP
jgi:hypothetical protein